MTAREELEVLLGPDGTLWWRAEPGNRVLNLSKRQVMGCADRMVAEAEAAWESLTADKLQEVNAAYLAEQQETERLRAVLHSIEEDAVEPPPEQPTLTPSIRCRYCDVKPEVDTMEIRHRPWCPAVKALTALEDTSAAT